jgi:hypothetical protein
MDSADAPGLTRAQLALDEPRTQASQFFGTACAVGLNRQNAVETNRDPDVVRQLIASQLEQLGLQYIAYLQTIQGNGGTSV